MKKSILLLTIVLINPALLIFLSCNDEPQLQIKSVPEINEFVIIPPVPSTREMVNMMTNDCKYNVLVSVVKNGKDITVKKRFNSQMKWPCILHYDTIPLGILSQGSYMVTLLIIDTNPYITDSISVRKTSVLKVGK